jgi:hypothetical protein
MGNCDINIKMQTESAAAKLEKRLFLIFSEHVSQNKRERNLKPGTMDCAQNKNKLVYQPPTDSQAT